MRSIEEKIDIPENRKDDFRREIMNFIGALAVDGKKFEWNTNDRLRRALELKLFEDQKDAIKLKTLVSAVVDKDTQEKIDIIKTRLIKNFGYNEVSATDVLNYVASHLRARRRQGLSQLCLAFLLGACEPRGPTQEGTMRTTFAVVAVLCAASLGVACDEDKKPAGTTPSATAATQSAAAMTPPPAPKPKPEEVIAKTNKALADAWNAHDAAKIATLYTSTGKLVIPGLGDFSGKGALMGEAKDNFTAYSDFKVAVTRTFIKGNTAVFEWVVTGKNDGPMMGKPATGRQMGVAGASVATYDDDGLIKEEHRYFDLPTLTSQLDPKAKAGTFRAAMTLPTAAPETHVVKGTPDEAKALDAGKAIYAAFEKKGGLDAMAFVTDDSVFDDYTNPATMKGPKPIKDWVTGFWTAVPDLAMAKPLQFAVDDYVISETVLTGTHKGPMGPLKATNKPVSFRSLDVMRLKDGKAAHFDTYGDMAEILVEIGAMPPIAAAPAAGAPAASGSAMAATAPTAPPAKPK